MNYSKVPTKLQELCDSINERRKNIDRFDVIASYNLSFDFHFFLVTIHPWADGNGRMSRLVINEIQLEMDIIPTITNKDSKAEYI